MASSSFRGAQVAILKALVDTTRTAGQLANEDLAFHRSVSTSLNESLEYRNTRLVSLAKDLTKVATSGTDLHPPHLCSVGSVDDEWRQVVDVLDNLLEKADACLDEYTGVIKKPSPAQEEQAKQAATSSSKQKPGKQYRSLNLPKPQLQFTNALANNDISMFKPIIKKKPHALVPLSESLQLSEVEDAAKQYKHPYDSEIQAAQMPPSVSFKREPVPYLPFDSTTAIFVDTFEAVQAMLEDLRKVDEIAVDLEHHDEHSYVGIVSLMQISTREKDWVIDTLQPWRQDLQVLNEVFADPKIVKVLHGSTMDIIWLQRDLGLYIVGLFDTYHASRALGYPKHSLAFLLKKFVDFDAAKQYQLADWRIRPLPPAMFDYARSDTHFLLYVYDMMRNELIDNSDVSIPGGNLVELVMANSKQEALQRYEQPVYDETHGSGQMGWYNMLYRTPALFNREQFAVFRAIHQWRDQVAREEDEGVNYVMPRKAMYSIARLLPVDMASLLGCSHPISKPLKDRKGHLLDIVKKARASAADQPEMTAFFNLKKSTQNGGSEGQSGSGTPAALHRSIGATLTALRSGGPLCIRAKTSTLWGPVIPDLNAHMPRAKNVAHLQFTLPLPPLTAEVFIDPITSVPESLPKPDAQPAHDARAEHPYVGERETDGRDLIIVRESTSARKRKFDDCLAERADADTQLAEGAENGESVETDLTEGILAERQKAERKREKREARAERKRQNRGNANGGKRSREPKEEDLEPVDYENVPSVLHAKTADGRRKKAPKSMNPYAKSMDASKGLRRMQREGPGKSVTFKK